MKKQIFPFIALLLLFATGLYGQQLEIHHLDVGQADATFIKSPTGITMLIDGGNADTGTNMILPYLSQLGVAKLNYVLCSHFHSDHIGGLDEVINGLGYANIDSVFDRGDDEPLPNSPAYTEYVAAANATGRRVKIEPGRIIDLGGGVTMKCVATDGEVINYGVVSGSSGSENDLSVGWVLTYNAFHYFTGGDLGGEGSAYADGETPLAAQLSPVDAFKVNHHGSAYSTNQTFVNRLKAKAAFISVGNGNSYKHPVQAVLTRLANAGCFIYQTETGNGGTIPAGKGIAANATIILKTSGSGFSVTHGNTTENYGISAADGNTTSTASFSLFPNYPNPFNAATVIPYDLKEGSFVTLRIYDCMGKEVKTLVNEYEKEGSYKKHFNGMDLPTGVYYYRLSAGKYTDAKKFVLLK